MIKPTKTKVDSDSGKAENSKTKASAKKSGQTEKPAVSKKTTAASKKKSGQEINAETKQSLKKESQKSLSDDLVKIIEARHHDPFSILGRHQKGNQTSITAYLPYAETVKLGNKGPELTRIPYTDFFEILLDPKDIQGHYQLNWIDKQGFSHEHHDPYDFGPILTDFDQHLFGEGKHWHIYKKLGAHLDSIDNVSGVRFAVWAPSAGRVSVVGDFNHWDGRCHPMRSLGGSGIWEIFIPDVNEGAYYKFEIRNRNSSAVMVKTDPYGLQFEYRPKTSSIVTKEDNYTWNDQQWIDQRSKFDWMHQPMSVYEVHLGSWRRDNLDNFLSYRELAKQLVDYVVEMGYTHIELLPINEHPLDISWGYQATGYFAPTSRFGKPDDFRYFIDMCHQNNIGVILDWVPAHFPKDGFALAQFDGSALYEHEDPRKGEHRDWGTLIYNYGRNEVKNFLISSAFFWMEEYHIDGLRVDAVASMLYLDYSREDGDWIPNQFGGNENLEAIDFLRQMNEVTHQEHPGTVVMAEESTAWPQVTRPVWTGGLGFSMKWNMGWMHDTLSYMSTDPVHRMHHHDQLTFGLLYAFTENFVLPFSHDEVVHGKNSMINKMPGDEWQRFANLRLLYTLMYVYPGKKLLFMGCEFGQGTEWNSTQQLDWYVLDYPNHQGVQSLVKDLNKLYKDHQALHDRDFDHEGFAWIDCHDVSKSIISFMRKSENETIIAVFNFTPVPRENYRIGVPEPGTYHEILNSDSSFYNGSNTGNGFVNSDEIVWMEQPHSINLTLPPLAGIVLKI